MILSSYLWSVAQSYVPHSSQSYVQVMVEDSAVDQRRQQTVRTRLARLQEACVVERGRSDAGVAELFDITKEREVKGVEKGADIEVPLGKGHRGASRELPFRSRREVLLNVENKGFFRSTTGTSSIPQRTNAYTLERGRLFHLLISSMNNVPRLESGGERAVSLAQNRAQGTGTAISFDTAL